MSDPFLSATRLDSLIAQRIAEIRAQITDPTNPADFCPCMHGPTREQCELAGCTCHEEIR